MFQALVKTSPSMVFQLVGAWPEYFCDDVWPLPGWGELVAVLVALHEMEYHAPDVEGSATHSSAVVPLQLLLLLGRAEEGDIAGFV